MKWLTPTFILVGSLAACGGNVKQLSCSGMDWENFGYKTARSGKSVKEFNQYRDGCGNSLEQDAKSDYLDGYTRGIVEYCTYDNGYALGKHDQPVNDICPAELRAAFLGGHKAGRFEIREIKRRFENVSEDSDMRDYD